MTTTGPTHVVELANGQLRRFEITPEEAGLARTSPEALKGGEPSENAAALRDVVSGKPGAYRDIAILNAAGALVVAGKAATLKDGAGMAAQAIDSGKVSALLDRLIAVTNA
jgi:anthranilate phosphoribosyltransferase